MRIKKKRKSFGEFSEGDMTPMIDMTFQLIAFFMVLINLEQAEQIQEVQVPLSTLVKVGDPPENPITIHVKRDYNGKPRTVIMDGNEYELDKFATAIGNLSSDLISKDKNLEDYTVVIRTDKNSPTAVHQMVMQACTDAKFTELKARKKVVPK